MKESIKNLASYIPPTPTEEVAKEYGLDHVVKLSANENPYGTSPKVAQAVIEAVKAIGAGNWYADSNVTKLRQMVAQAFDVKGENIIFGCGLDEIIAVAMRTFLQTGDEVLVADPTFSEYELNVLIEGASVKRVPVDQQTGANDLTAFLAAITPATKVIVLCNPNNPTGGFNTINELRQFMQQVPEDVVVLIDEAYVDFAGDNVSAMPLVKEFKNVGVMRTFSKAYGLAGYHVGFIIIDDEYARYLQTVRLPYNLNLVSQVAAETAFANQTFVKDVVAKNATERQGWENFLAQQGIFYYPSATNFVFFRVDKADELAQRLLENGYQIRSGMADGWLRVTVGLPEDNLAMQAIMAEFLAEK